MHHPSQVHALFSQLQARYPMSSLITELVQVQNDLFVVRALVQTNGMAVATGMAAASSIELAEDQARLRVLALLGVSSALNGSAPPQTYSPLPEPALASNGFTPLPPLPASTWTNSEPTIASVAQPTFADEPLIVPQQMVADDRVPEYLVDDLDDSFTAPGTEESSLVDESPLQDETLPHQDDSAPEQPVFSVSTPAPKADDIQPGHSPKPKKVAAKATEIAPSEPLPEPPSEPIEQEPDDLSSLIALTDIEMDRIGWTKQEGREYLKRTYKKSTRQRLDVDELMDFLNYLRALPSLNGL
ncbi:MAG: hypothetical protein NW224_28350 [Leptolyngbyaceae cyanobacterium bins.302]|nr:hypothetical protein [Leptolyngbyaceae cyanobacterium bins.302]